MRYRKCNTCKNKSCLKTKLICESMDRWLKKYVETPQRELLFRNPNDVMKLHGVGDNLENACQ
jgi:hypothetical protein